MNTSKFIKKAEIIILIVVLVLSLGACSTWDKLDKTEKGAVIGGGSGALIGSQVGGTSGAIIGGATGGVAGGVIGHEIEKDDRRR